MQWGYKATVAEMLEQVPLRDKKKRYNFLQMIDKKKVVDSFYIVIEEGRCS